MPPFSRCFIILKADVLDHDKPMNWPETTACCGKRLITFYGPSEVRKGINFIFFEKKKDVRRIAMAHNAARFDAPLLARHLLEAGHTPKIVSRGNSVLQLSLNGVVCKVYYFFLPGCLFKKITPCAYHQAHPCPLTHAHARSPLYDYGSGAPKGLGMITNGGGRGESGREGGNTSRCVMCQGSWPPVPPCLS